MTVTVNAERAYKKLNRLKSKIFDAARYTAKTLATKGAYYAKSLAPYYTGETAAAIRAKPESISSSSVKWVIVSPEVHEFPVVRVMHGKTEFAKHHWSEPVPGKQQPVRSEQERQYMYTTRKWLNSIKKETAKGGFRNIRINQ